MSVENTLTGSKIMAIEIRNRWTGAVLYVSEAATLGAAVQAAVASGVNLRGADLSEADLSWTNLRGANLSEANLSWANLRGTDLTGADLYGADLTGVNLYGVNLYGVNLSWTNLRRANLSWAKGLPEAPRIECLDARILGAIESGGSLDMDAWHTCATTHCRAGWAITLAGEAGRNLEERYGPSVAGALIYQASVGRVPDFLASGSDALADIRACAAKQQVGE